MPAPQTCLEKLTGEVETLNKSIPLLRSKKEGLLQTQATLKQENEVLADDLEKVRQRNWKW